MRKLSSFILLLGISFITKAESRISSPVSFVRIGETSPSTRVFVLDAYEQMVGQAFQQDAIISYKGYQYTVYYNLERYVCIARRKLPLGDWEEVKLSYKNVRNDVHNVICMGICANDGSIHLSYDLHINDLRYAHSVRGSANDPDNMPWNTDSFSNTKKTLGNGIDPFDITYPRFISKPDGNLLFEYRYKLSGDGDSYLAEYDGVTGKWTYLGRYIQGRNARPNLCAYINRIDYDINGRLHVSWCWRDNVPQSNIDINYAYSDDHARNWQDIYGTIVAGTENYIPLKGQDSRDKVTGNCLHNKISTLKIKDIPKNKGYMNSESQTTDSKGKIHIINSYMEGPETDDDWNSSRSKAVLHHHYLDENNILHHRLVKKNNKPVHSYCRTQIVADAFDNMYVIANGAELYVATPQCNYEDWQLLTNKDVGRFISEPQVDRPLLMNEGILSFVYLAVNNRLTVIDYLLDNPQKPSGTGLSVECFEDMDFQQPFNFIKGVEVDFTVLPDDVRSVRWSGIFETQYGEIYTMYLTTSEEAKVYIDGIKVLDTGEKKYNNEPMEYDFTFNAIASHKHDIVIEVRKNSNSLIALEWSSARTLREKIPVTSLYPVIRGDLPVSKKAVFTENEVLISAENNVLEVNSTVELSNIKIYDIAGICYLNSDTSGNNFSVYLDEGIYIVQVNTSGEVVTRKIYVR